jgi:hypothetical protein
MAARSPRSKTSVNAGGVDRRLGQSTASEIGQGVPSLGRPEAAGGFLHPLQGIGQRRPRGLVGGAGGGLDRRAGGRGPRMGRLPRGAGFPARWATASGNVQCFSLITSAAASPCSEHPSHFQVFLIGLTWNDGFLSSWKGHFHQRRPFPPRRPGAGPSRLVATAARSIRSRIADQSRRPGGAVIFRRFSIPTWRASIQAYQAEPFRPYQYFRVTNPESRETQGQNLPVFRAGQTGSNRS